MSKTGSATMLVVASFVATLSVGEALSQARRSPVIPGGNSRAPIAIDAEKLEYIDQEQKFVYSGNVVARQGDATLKAARVTVFLERDANAKPGAAKPAEGGNMNDQIKRIEAHGGVTVTSKDQVGTGDWGYFDKPNNKVFLIGHPVLTQGPNVVKGAPDGKLEYDLTSGRANIAGGRVQSIFTPGSEEKKPGPATRKPDNSR